jgi:AraC-like DNA-binding protein
MAMTTTAAADRAATWYGEGRPAGPTARPGVGARGPRALEARGFATLHHILVQLADVGLRPRFAETCRAFGDVVWCDDVDELVARAGVRQALAVVVDATDRSGLGTARAVAAIRRDRPGLPVVLWCDRDAAGGPAAAAVIAAGVSAVVFRDGSDLEQRLLSAITRATDVTFHQLTDQTLHRRVPEALIPVFRYVLDRATAMPDAATIARAAGLSPRQLEARLREAGMPPLTALVTWSRVLTAAYRLERTTRPVAEVAGSVGLASSAALGRLLRRCANETTRGVRQPGGFGWVLRCFERLLSRPR